jgi:nicotinamide mononucleotide adenylyltransferase
MLRMRRGTPALIAGAYTPLHEEAEDYIAFLRSSTADGQTCLVILNMSDQSHTLKFNLGPDKTQLVFSSHLRESDTENPSRIGIAPFEVYVAELT